MQKLNNTDLNKIYGGYTWQENWHKAWLKVCDFFSSINQTYDDSGVTGWPSTLPYM